MTVSEIEGRLKAAVLGSWFPVDTLECMAALCTFGFEHRPVPVTKIHSVEAPEKDTWWARMEKTSKTGYDFVEIFRGWHKPTGLPDGHRMRDVRAYADFHVGLIRSWRRAPMISEQETLRRRTIKHLAETTNTKLAAALLASGFKLDTALPITTTERFGAKQSTFWIVVGEDDSSRRRLLELVGNWEKFSEFELKEPEHPMCYHRAYAENRERLIALHKESIPQILIPRGGRCILVTPGLLPRYKRQLEKML